MNGLLHRNELGQEILCGIIGVFVEHGKLVSQSVKTVPIIVILNQVIKTCLTNSTTSHIVNRSLHASFSLQITII